eukprot:2252718-Amphidinium_carterae.1
MGGDFSHLAKSFVLPSKNDPKKHMKSSSTTKQETRRLVINSVFSRPGPRAALRKMVEQERV